jgi:hypothetical protein
MYICVYVCMHIKIYVYVLVHEWKGKWEKKVKFDKAIYGNLVRIASSAERMRHWSAPGDQTE